MTQENNNTTGLEEDAIDIIALLKEFWNARKTILKITGTFFLLGLFVAIFSKNEYTAATTFVPLAQGSSVGGGSLGSLASLAGINIGGGVNSEEISPELYPQIVSSIPFQLELLNMPLSIEGQSTPVSYKEYYKNIYSPGFLSSIKKYTLGLPGVLMNLLKSEGVVVEASKNAKQNKIITISDFFAELIERISSAIAVWKSLLS